MGRLWRALFFSFAGLKDAWLEPACRLEILAVVVAVPLALWLPVSRIERVLLIVSALFVLTVELLNTSIERTVDRIGVERHELSRRAKDLGSAAVFVATLIAATVWLTIAGPPMAAMLGY
jgi:diacylglycerol kinase (ATP)